jgi:arsenite methyltransferase
MTNVITPQEDIAAFAGSDIREAVRARYAETARSLPLTGAGCGCSATGGCGCSEGPCCGPSEVWGADLYDDVSKGLAPDTALLASLGCGNPVAVAELRDGEVVLDLGSGAGLDVLLSAKRVGPEGKAFGLDMTDEMRERALENKARAGVTNVEFLKGYIEEIPLPADSVDVVISNCVVNLSADKPRVFQEVFRVLREGGRIGITDVVADSGEARGEQFDPESWSACLSGALTRDEYGRELGNAGFVDVDVVDSHGVADGYISAIIRARKPEG